MNVFISGGCKNGKSYYAQELAREESLRQGVPLYYVATMIPTDGEDQARIARHLEERNGWGFTTLEQGRDIMDLLSRKDVESKGIFLLDSVTALLSNEMFPYKEDVNLQAGKKVAEDLSKFAKMTGNTVFVSDFIYSDALAYDEWTEIYKKGLAHCDKTLAVICDKVIEVAYGSKYEYK
ncbi:MAG: bifunctional adenosylcobinamide kinase/adenosylcobinamide-phosphate guanylyltransferase [Anaerovoracaceae bacterium]